MARMRDKSASEQGNLIEKGVLSPVSLTEEYLDAISNHPYTNRIYTEVFYDTVLYAALQSEKRAKTGSRKSLLDGVPIAWKDLVDFVGIPTKAGSKLLNSRLPVKDAVILKNARTSGLLELGKTHMTELAFSGLGLNPITETPPNSINPNLVAGGSSSGSAVCTATKLAAAAIGSDTGGSVRVPAAWNNLVGLKTTVGVLNMSGVLPLCPSFDTIGPITKTVEDSANIFNILKGRPDNQYKVNSVKNITLLLDTSFLFFDVDTKIKNAVNESIELLRQAGVKIESKKLLPISQSIKLASDLFTPEAYAAWGEKIEKYPELMFPPILERFRSGKDLKAHTFLDSWEKLKLLRKDYLSVTSNFDGVIGPTTPILPPQIDKLIHDSSYFIRKNLLALRNTRVANILGLCSLTLPTKFDHCGLMVLAPPNTEDMLLQIGSHIEKIIRPESFDSC